MERAADDLRSLPAASSCCFSRRCDGRDSTMGERRPSLGSSTSIFLSSLLEAAGLEAAAAIAFSGEEFLWPPPPPSESVSPADPDEAEEEVDSRLPAPPLALSAMSARGEEEKAKIIGHYPSGVA